MPSDRTRPFARHDPATWTRALAYRPRADLPYDAAACPPGTMLMLDTTVYIDARKVGQLPDALAARMAASPILHSAVAMSELAANLGLLDPVHPATPAVRAAIVSTLERVDPQRVVAPSADAWMEAAVIAGTLARTQGLAKDDRRKLLADALIFLGADEARAVLVSRNKNDVDLLLRFRPDVRVLLYDTAPTPQRP